ncbi:hypothetical protein JR316_0000982 [Psilocybe cubensis]|uniref:Uncharacterized protein n=1 Tax=Psilocybe cubensis TaxID=181762 RepID=A0ACB8HGF4_PSICU|nr:hypothetical protein JR316_0000982 [Psilocybe cubensis]KAH9486916.1 hypothetical protein JR316_0000982 [Psilocybe cubensis]
MGSSCSKTSAGSAYEGGHTVLGSGPVSRNQATARDTNREAPKPSDPRAAAAEAAERRLQAAQNRGTNKSNPNQGKLSEQLAKQNSSKPGPPQQEVERLVWD